MKDLKYYALQPQFLVNFTVVDYSYDHPALTGRWYAICSLFRATEVHYHCALILNSHAANPCMLTHTRSRLR